MKIRSVAVIGLLFFCCVIIIPMGLMVFQAMEEGYDDSLLQRLLAEI
jgi:hypothetical protein